MEEDVKEADCWSGGYTKVTCAREGCDHEGMINWSPALGHEFAVEQASDNFAPWTPAVCTREGCDHRVYVANTFTAVPAAYVIQDNGNTNRLFITVTETFNNGSVRVFESGAITIRNNTSGVFHVGDYRVFVNTQGNTQIRALYIVEDDAGIYTPYMTGIEDPDSIDDVPECEDEIE
jgi:hypothetical protein